MNESNGVAWSVADGLGRIELCRPQSANSLRTATGHALIEAIHGVLAAAPKAVLLSAQGPVFCAGGDVGEFVQAGERFDDVVDGILDPLHPAIERLALSPAPVVCALSGTVGGAGVGLALGADFVLASTTLKLRTGYAALGLSPDLGTSWFLSRRVGSQRAKQWLLLSDPVDAETCLRHGAVDALHAPEALPAAAEALAQRLARGARGSNAAIKRLCDGVAQRDLRTHLALEHELLREQTRTADGREGVRAFVARRAPRFMD